jgi:adenylate kinase family enzyme
MKIIIYGFSGSGKSTLSKLIAKEYELPILHVDKILYNPGWERKTKDESREIMAKFLNAHKNWVIDGNGNSLFFDERMKMADKIIFMNFSRWTCFKQAKQRYKEYKDKPRESRPEGCEEKFNFSFIWWILFSGRATKRVKKFKSILKTLPEKIIVLKNRKDVKHLISHMDTVLLK